MVKETFRLWVDKGKCRDCLDARALLSEKGIKFGLQVADDDIKKIYRERFSKEPPILQIEKRGGESDYKSGLRAIQDYISASKQN